MSELRPNTASVLYDPDDYSWHDEDWLASRPDALGDFPLNIYEVHLVPGAAMKTAVF
jgi:1,4-alpha-glucan branching enzyme